MLIKVSYFGLIAEITGKKTETIELEKEQTIEDLMHKLTELYPEIKKNIHQIAINHKQCSTNTKIYASDEIALMPQFSGG